MTCKCRILKDAPGHACTTAEKMASGGKYFNGTPTNFRWWLMPWLFDDNGSFQGTVTCHVSGQNKKWLSREFHF